MLISRKWLQELIEDALPDPAEVARVLTARGLTVDASRPVDDDTVFDVDVPANRPDALGHIGVAREVAAGLGLTLRRRYVPKGSEDGLFGLVTVNVEEPKLCPRYTASSVHSVSVGPSPKWVVSRLESCGLRSINNVVDISNLVMLETGHPNHVFDVESIRGKNLTVRLARDGETLVTLDGVSRRLDSNMLVIADKVGPTALAGVMGGAKSEIRATTNYVLIEAAWFLPRSVRATARRLGLSTDASQRFERGADLEGAFAAQEMCRRLLAEICGGKPNLGLIDTHAPMPPRPSLTLRVARVKLLLGYEPTLEEICRALAAVGLDPRNAGDGIIQVTVPSWRVDLEREADLIEEVARHIGYDHIPEAEPAVFPARAGAATVVSDDERGRDLLAGRGFHEAFNYAMIGPGEDDAFVAAGTPASMALANPLAEPLGSLRRSILPGLIRAAAANLRRGVEHARLFEVGRVFHSRGAEFPDEPLRLGFVWAGAALPPHWTAPARPVDFWDAIGVAQSIIDAFRPGAALTSRDADLPGFQPGRRALLQTDAGPAAWCGVVDPAVTRALDAPGIMVAGELDLDVITKLPNHAPRYAPLPRVPGSERDLAIVVDADVSAARILEVLAAIPSPAPARFVVVDRYVGPPLGIGESSLTVRVILQPLERTLTDTETEDFRARLVAALDGIPGVRLRG